MLKKSEQKKSKKDAKQFVKELLTQGLNSSLIHDILVDEGYTKEEIKEARKQALAQGVHIKKPLGTTINYIRLLAIIFVTTTSIVLLSLIYSSLQAWPGEGINTYAPIQETYAQKEPIIIVHGSNTYYLTPKARYNATVMVAHTKRYFIGPVASIAPIDMFFLWGSIPTEDYRSYMKVSQKMRRGGVKLSKNSPYDYRYVYMQGSNNHIIPANDELKKILLKVQKHDIVSMEGYLVNVENSRMYPWSSSMTRSDEGNGACEIFYVNKVIIDDIVYQ